MKSLHRWIESKTCPTNTRPIRINDPIDDVRTPPDKAEILERYEGEAERVEINSDEELSLTASADKEVEPDVGHRRSASFPRT